MIKVGHICQHSVETNPNLSEDFAFGAVTEYVGSDTILSSRCPLPCVCPCVRTHERVNARLFGRSKSLVVVVVGRREGGGPHSLLSLKTTINYYHGSSS